MNTWLNFLLIKRTFNVDWTTINDQREREINTCMDAIWSPRQMWLSCNIIASFTASKIPNVLHSQAIICSDLCCVCYVIYCCCCWCLYNESILESISTTWTSRTWSTYKDHLIGMIIWPLLPALKTCMIDVVARGMSAHSPVESDF